MSAVEASLTVPVAHPSVVAVRTKIATLVREVETVAITDDETKAAAVNLLSAIARLKTDAERARLGFVRPLKAYTSAVDKLFRELLAPVLAAEGDTGRPAPGTLRRKVLDYDAAERKRIAEAQAEEEKKRLEADALLESATTAEAEGKPAIATALLEQAATAEQRAIEIKPAAAAAPPPKTFSTPFGARATSRTEWDLEIVDAAAIPREWLILDELRMRRAVRDGTLRPGQGGEQPIPGVRIFERDALTVR